MLTKFFYKVYTVLQSIESLQSLYKVYIFTKIANFTILHGVFTKCTNICKL